MEEIFRSIAVVISGTVLYFSLGRIYRARRRDESVRRTRP